MATARRCEICRRGSIAGASRSHSNIKTKRRLHVNLQTKTIKGVLMRICTRCMRTLLKRPRTA